MTQTPETSDQRRMTHAAITRNNRGNGDHMIGVGSVPHPQEEAQHDDRQEIYQAHILENELKAPQLTIEKRELKLRTIHCAAVSTDEKESSQR